MHCTTCSLLSSVSSSITAEVFRKVGSSACVRKGQHMPHMFTILHGMSTETQSGQGAIHSTAERVSPDATGPGRR